MVNLSLFEISGKEAACTLKQRKNILHYSVKFILDPSAIQHCTAQQRKGSIYQWDVQSSGGSHKVAPKPKGKADDSVRAPALDANDHRFSPAHSHELCYKVAGSCMGKENSCSFSRVCWAVGPHLK